MRRGRQPLLRRAPPQMADGQRQRVRAVGRPGRIGQLQQPANHLGDLLLAGPAVPGHRRLDLARRVQRDRNAAPRGAHDGDRASLRRAHDGTHVVLAEHALHRDGVRLMAGQPLIELNFQG